MEKLNSIILNLAESRYRSEIDRRRHAYTVMSIYLGGLTILLGFLINYVPNLKIIIYPICLESIGTYLLVIILLGVFYILYHLFSIIRGKKGIGYPAKPKEIMSYLDRLKKFYSAEINGENETKVLQDFIDGMAKSYAECVELIILDNNDKFNRLRIIGTTLVIEFFLVLITLIVDKVLI